MFHDFDDALVVEMIKENHKPEEVYHWSPGYGKQLQYIICGGCATEWPCLPIVTLRKRQENGTGQIL